MKVEVKLSRYARKFAKGYWRAIKLIDAGKLNKAITLAKPRWWRNPVISYGAKCAVEKHNLILKNK